MRKLVDPHVRLTAQQLKADYEAGLLPAPTYLLYLIRSLRKDGHRLSIEGVTEFCAQWGIPLRTFYRAKAKLISLGLLQEEIRGRVDLWVPTPAEQAEEAAEAETEIAAAEPEEAQTVEDPMPWLVRDGHGHLAPDPDFLSFLQREYSMKPANAKVFVSCLSGDPARLASQRARVKVYWQEYQTLAATPPPSPDKGKGYKFIDLPNGDRVGMVLPEEEEVHVESHGVLYAVSVGADGKIRVQEVVGHGC